MFALAPRRCLLVASLMESPPLFRVTDMLSAEEKELSGLSVKTSSPKRSLPNKLLSMESPVLEVSCVFERHGAVKDWLWVAAGRREDEPGPGLTLRVAA